MLYVTGRSARIPARPTCTIARKWGPRRSGSSRRGRTRKRSGSPTHDAARRWPEADCFQTCYAVWTERGERASAKAGTRARRDRRPRRVAARGKSPGQFKSGGVFSKRSAISQTRGTEAGGGPPAQPASNEAGRSRNAPDNGLDRRHRGHHLAGMPSERWTSTRSR